MCAEQRHGSKGAEAKKRRWTGCTTVSRVSLSFQFWVHDDCWRIRTRGDSQESRWQPRRRFDVSHGDPSGETSSSLTTHIAPPQMTD
jgi:hypothetical protein